MKLKLQIRQGHFIPPSSAAAADATKWTLVQGILAPVQFLVFIVSVGLILRYLMTGQGLWAADLSVIIKTLTLYTIIGYWRDLGEGKFSGSICSLMPSSGKMSSRWR